MTNAEIRDALDWVLGRESRAMDRNSARKLLDLREEFAARAVDDATTMPEYDKSDATDFSPEHGTLDIGDYL